MRFSKVRTIWLFLFAIFFILISGMACPQAAESLTSYIDEHNRFILNGEPFFPLGLYVVQCTNGSYSAELDEIADSPFDTLMNYAVNQCGTDATDAQIFSYLDQLEPRDLKLIFSLAEYFDGGQPATATWTLTVAVDGSYDVYIYWKASPNRATDAPYTINYNGGSQTVKVNQKINGSTWNLLGNFPFVTTVQGSVVLGNDADGFVIADAIKVEGAGPGGTDIILDEEQASYVDSWTYVSSDPAAFNSDCRWHAKFFDDIATITHKVSTFRTHPAVISWYLNDERDPATYLTQLEERYAKIRELDENHPVWSVHWNTDWLIQEAHTTDIVGVDPYPIAHLPITHVSQMADAANAAGKPLWLVPQIFRWTDYHGDFRAATGRPPTPEEMRAMSYLAINHGAKGLIYYSYFNIRDDIDYKTRWKEIKEIAGEIRDLRPVFLSTYQTNDTDIVCNNGNIDFKLMREGNTYYLFAVNKDVPSQIIIDNSEATYEGDWPTMQGNPPDNYPYGGDFQENKTLNGDTATWTPDIAEAGEYRVYATWTAGIDRATNASYTINYDGGSEQVTVDQQANGDRWILLGSYRFAAGTSGSVILTDNVNGVVIADAIMWLLKEGDVTSASFQINLAHKPAVFDTMFEDGRQVPVVNGKVTDDFDVYEVHVYHWGNPDSDGSSSGGGSGGGSSSGGCFIATAAFGSPMEKHVTVLRSFKDTYLLPHALGRIFVRMYNKYSPPLAHFIAEHEMLKVAACISLLPLVAVSYATLHFGPVTMLIMLVVLLILPIFLVSFYRRRGAAVR